MQIYAKLYLSCGYLCKFISICTKSKNRNINIGLFHPVNTILPILGPFCVFLYIVRVHFSIFKFLINAEKIASVVLTYKWLFL